MNGASPLDLLHAGLAGLAEADVPAMADAEIAEQLRALLAAANTLDAVICARLGSFDARALSEADGFRATRSWLRAFGRMSQGAASGWLARARLLRQLPALAGAAGDGHASAESVDVVARLAGQSFDNSPRISQRV